MRYFKYIFNCEKCGNSFVKTVKIPKDEMTDKWSILFKCPACNEPLPSIKVLTIMKDGVEVKRK